MNEIENYSEIIFEKIKHIDEYGNEYWIARELQKIIEYKEWRKFEGAITKAIKSCEQSNFITSDHFVNIDKMVTIGSGAQRKQKNYCLSRYACYLIAQNGESNISRPNIFCSPNKRL